MSSCSRKYICTSATDRCLTAACLNAFIPSLVRALLFPHKRLRIRYASGVVTTTEERNLRESRSRQESYL
eukprot:16319-Heterococcus_DN1.PRE.2